MFSFNFVKNWKTSSLGLVSSVATYMLQNNGDAGFTWASLKACLPGLVMGLILGDPAKKQQ